MPTVILFFVFPDIFKLKKLIYLFKNSISLSINLLWKTSFVAALYVLSVQFQLITKSAEYLQSNSTHWAHIKIY